MSSSAICNDVKAIDKQHARQLPWHAYADSDHENSVRSCWESRTWTWTQEFMHALSCLLLYNSVQAYEQVSSATPVKVPFVPNGHYID